MAALMRLSAILCAAFACVAFGGEELEGSGSFDDLFLLQQGMDRQKVELKSTGEKTDFAEPQALDDAVNMMQAQLDSAGELVKRGQKAKKTVNMAELETPEWMKHSNFLTSLFSELKKRKAAEIIKTDK
mmetsp:Transcript_34978/g.57382  ORF Transcript_34978/g.57382 Transcript_34978/m.57382 type:complete len:129 (-) Transcript_34978:42-428(-)